MTIDSETFTITNTTMSTLPSVPFGAIKEASLGKKYSLSLVFIGHKKSRTLNKSYRGKDKSTNILSFSYEKNEGEIFINLNKARKEAVHFGRKFQNYISFLFIHGLMHLKGMRHGSTMERAEIKLRKRFHI